jgi:hypothetical protein
LKNIPRDNFNSFENVQIDSGQRRYHFQLQGLIYAKSSELSFSIIKMGENYCVPMTGMSGMCSSKTWFRITMFPSISKQLTSSWTFIEFIGSFSSQTKYIKDLFGKNIGKLRNQLNETFGTRSIARDTPLVVLVRISVMVFRASSHTIFVFNQRTG